MPLGIDPFGAMVEERHPIFDLADELNAATDAYGDAVDAEALAEAAYDRAFAIAFVKNDDVAATVRRKYCDALVVDEKEALTFAHARSVRGKAKVEALHSQLMAHQSFMRLERNVT